MAGCRFKMRVAGLLIEIEADYHFSSFKRFEQFYVQDESTPDLHIFFQGESDLILPNGQVCLSDVNNWLVSRDGVKRTTVYKCSIRRPDTEPIYVVEADGRWKDITVKFLANNANVEEECTILIGTIILKNRIALENGLIIHAAAIDWQGKGILFTAPSETGKSTQARLWGEHEGATILNDDSPAIRIAGQGATVYGTPWSGGKLLYENAQSKLAAIVVLEQAPKNEIKQLNLAESTSMVLPRCMLPYHDADLLSLASSTLTEIISSVPICHLKCTATVEAVEMTKSMLTNTW